MREDSEGEDHLSKILTELSLVRAGDRREGEPDTELRHKRDRFFKRYRWATHRYLRAILKSDLLADEAFQRFAVLYLEGRLSKYDPQRVPFHVYLKTVLRNEAWRLQRQGREESLGSDAENIVADHASAASEFDQAVREQLVARAMQVLKQEEERGDHLDHSLVLLLSELPRHQGRKATATDVADLLEQRTGERPQEEAARRRRSRAKRRFGDKLQQAAWNFLEDPTPERVESLLRDVQLWQYCRPTSSGGSLELD